VKARSSFAGEVLVARYQKAREASGVKRSTLKTDGTRLALFLAWLAKRRINDLRSVTPEDLRAYQRHLGAYRYRVSKAEHAPSKPLASRSRFDALLHVCLFFRWLVASRALLADPSLTLELGRRARFQPANVLTEEEARRVLAAPDTRTLIGLRDRALLELLYSTGLRRAEAAALDLGDIDLTGGAVFVSRGKGDKSRLVPLGENAAAALRLYIGKARPRFATKPGACALFLASDRCGQTGMRLSGASIELRVELAGRRAGIERPITPHALRHSLATHLLRAGASLRHVQAILGHARIDTTEAYTHLVIEDLAKAHARSHPRGRPKR
jgi:integrase/recombinase XerD